MTKSRRLDGAIRVRTVWLAARSTMAVLALFLLIVSPAAAQQVANSVETGLQSLAQDIAAKTTADRNRIAVLPFPNADGTCSVLSTYLADELIQALAVVPNRPFDIVERTQLESIFQEMKFNAAGILDPETTQSLGRISGVKAITIGTITKLADRIRVTARLMATDTGNLISAAAVNIRRTPDIDTLLEQTIAGQGGVCGARVSTQPRVAGGQPTAGSPAAAGPDPAMPPATVRSVTAEGLSIYTQSVTRSADRKSVTLVMTLTNRNERPIRAIIASPKPSILDDAANIVELASVTGLQGCYNFGNPASDVCRQSYQGAAWTTLNPNSPLGVVMRFQSRDAGIGDKLLNISALILVAPQQFGEDVHENRRSIHDISISFSNLAIDGVGRR